MKIEISRKIIIYSFIMALFVMLFHLTLFDNMQIEETTYGIAFYRNFEMLINKLCGIALNFFFMTSAFLLYNNAQGNIRRKLKGRVKSLIVPFVVWNAGFAMYMVVIDRTIIWNVETILKGFSLFPFDGPLWFTFALIIGLLLFPILSYANRKTSWLVFGISLLGAYHGRFYLEPDNEYTNWIFRLSAYIPAYFAGFLMAKLFPEKITKEAYNVRKVGIISCVLLLLMWGPMQRLFASCNFIILIAPMLEVILIWLIVPSSIFRRKIPFPFTLSFFMYSGHMAASKLVGKITRPIFQEKLRKIEWNGIEACLIRIAFTLWAYLLLLAGALFLQKFATRVFFILNGGKRQRE